MGSHVDTYTHSVSPFHPSILVSPPVLWNQKSADMMEESAMLCIDDGRTQPAHQVPQLLSGHSNPLIQTCQEPVGSSQTHEEFSTKNSAQVQKPSHCWGHQLSYHHEGA